MRLDPATRQAYDAARELAGQPFPAGCYAPFVALLFDTVGNVRVCCKNFSHLLGNLQTTRLDEIWAGDNLRRLREALVQYDFGLGCELCHWQIAEGNHANAFPRYFDPYPAGSGDELWPALMEFSISNTCNLQCLMCNGEYSSAIRARREHLPPLPRAYDERFFHDLRKYLPHLRRAKFPGGEPFLAAECFRIWEILIADGLAVPCHVNTNATQYNDRIERVLDQLPVSFSVSLDGVTKETFEAIRVGADFDTVLANFRRFHAYARERGTFIGLSHCLLRQNWREFGEFLLFADAWDVEVYVCTVVFPANASLYTLPPAELARVVEELERQEATLLPRLGKNRQVWLQELAQLRHRRDERGAERPPFVALRVVEPFANPPWSGTVAEAAQARTRARERLAGWAPAADLAELTLDPADLVETIDSPGGDFCGLAAEMCLGRRLDVVLSQFRLQYGGGTRLEILADEPSWADRALWFYPAEGDPTVVRLVTVPRVDAEGRLAGSYTLAALRRGPAAELTAPSAAAAEPAGCELPLVSPPDTSATPVAGRG